jgi:hypothetical protein
MRSGSYDQCDLQDLNGMMDAIKGISDPDDLTKESMDSIATYLIESLKAKLESVIVDEMMEDAGRLLKVFLAADDTKFHSILVSRIAVQQVVERCLACTRSYRKYSGAKSKGNLAEFNKVYLNFRAYSLKKEDQQPLTVDVLRAALKGSADIISAHKQVQTDKAKQAKANFQGLLQTFQDVAYGTRDRKSWKTGLSEKISLKKLLEHAHTPGSGLVHGPGKLVMSAKSELAKVPVGGIFVATSIGIRVYVVGRYANIVLGRSPCRLGLGAWMPPKPYRVHKV